MQQHVSQRINHTHQQRWLCLDCIGESILKRRLFTAWIICVMCTSKLKARPANEAFVPSKGLKCNLLLTHWRCLTTTDHHLGSASIMYSIWGLMWTCSKADAAVRGVLEDVSVENACLCLCVFYAKSQWCKDLGQKAKQQKVPELNGSRARRKIHFTEVTAQAWPSSKNIFPLLKSAEPSGFCMKHILGIS